MPKTLPPPPEMISEGTLYKGEIFIVAGAPGVGKSRFQLKLLHGLATGEPGWWGHLPPMKVLFCSQRSLKVTGAQMRTVGITELPDNLQVFCPPDLKESDKIIFDLNPLDFMDKHVIDKSDPPKVVVIDTLYTYLPKTKEFNFNNYNDLCRGCDKLYYWAQRGDFAVVLSHHTAKQKSDSKHEVAIERVLGSQGIMAVCIAACIMEHYTPNDPTYVRTYFLTRLSKVTAERYFHGDAYREVSVEEISSFGQLPTSTTKLGETEKRILDEVPYILTDYLDVWMICNSKQSTDKSNLYRTLDRLISKSLLVGGTNEDTGAKQVARIRAS
jgi:hypothetical protein